MRLPVKLHIPGLRTIPLLSCHPQLSYTYRSGRRRVDCFHADAARFSIFPCFLGFCNDPEYALDTSGQLARHQMSEASCEHLPDFFDASTQSINVFCCVVYMKTDSRRCWQFEFFHQRLAAVMTCTNAYVLLVKNTCDIVWMYPFYYE